MKFLKEVLKIENANVTDIVIYAVNPALGKLMQEDGDLEAHLDYIVIIVSKHKN